MPFAGMRRGVRLLPMAVRFGVQAMFPVFDSLTPKSYNQPVTARKIKKGISSTQWHQYLVQKRYVLGAGSCGLRSALYFIWPMLAHGNLPVKPVVPERQGCEHWHALAFIGIAKG